MLAKAHSDSGSERYGDDRNDHGFGRLYQRVRAAAAPARNFS